MQASSPCYHLRSNKHVDRLIFAYILSFLSNLYPISKYWYIGLGSYLFDDFKILHKHLGIHKMTSLEKDPLEFRRAKFNVPYKCISLENRSTTNFLSDLRLEQSGTIIWLDFASPKEIASQFDDYSTAIQKMHDGDIIRITLNANPSSLGGSTSYQNDELHEYRKRELIERLGDYAPDEANISNKDLQTSRYPALLLRCLEKTTYESLKADKTKIVQPLFACAYSDGTQMLTFTGIICDKNKITAKTIQQHDLKKICSFSWNGIEKLNTPPLTVQEMDSINKLLPATKTQRIKKRFDFVFKDDESAISSYVKHYANYPNYHDVSF